MPVIDYSQFTDGEIVTEMKVDGGKIVHFDNGDVIIHEDDSPFPIYAANQNDFMDENSGKVTNTGKFMKWRNYRNIALIFGISGVIDYYQNQGLEYLQSLEDQTA